MPAAPSDARTAPLVWDITSSVRGLHEFVREASIELDRVRQRDDIERYPEANLIRYSVLPWFDFTSISHARDFSRDDSAPRITFGKITEADGRWTMPVSIHAHHALATACMWHSSSRSSNISWMPQTQNLCSVRWCSIEEHSHG